MRYLKSSLALMVSASFALAASLATSGCASKKDTGFTSTDASANEPGDSGPGLIGDDAKPACDGLKCQLAECTNGTTTSLTGVVYDPAGRVPLYNVIVYVPNAELQPLAEGAACDKCGASVSGSPIATALTDSHGKFVLENVPVGNDIPLVIQVGKWRRQVKVPVVVACQDNLVAPSLSRLPRNQKEGDMPQMAISTGDADPLPCLFPRMGIDPREFTVPTGNGKVHIFVGNGGNVVGGPAPYSHLALWNNASSLKKYDIVLLSCEGNEYNEYKTADMKAALRDYLNEGGRVFATHYHYTWFKNGPSDMAGVATWTNSSEALPSTSYTIDQSFPKGQAFADWLVNVRASNTKGRLDLRDVKSDVTAVSSAAQRWVYTNGSVGYMSFNTPVGKPADDQCGRAVFSDIHVSSGEDASMVPQTCSTDELTPQEKALEFMFFDLAACVAPDGEVPKPPPH